MSNFEYDYEFETEYEYDDDTNIEFTVFVERENVIYGFNAYEEMIQTFNEEPIWNSEEEIFEILHLDEEEDEDEDLEDLNDWLNDIRKELPENSATIEEL